VLEIIEDLRKPFFFLALVFLALAVLVEVGSMAFVTQHTPSASALDTPNPGRGIPTMALLDVLVLYATGIMGLAFISQRIQGKVQGIITLVVGILVLLACIPVLFGEIALLILMVSLLLSPPFGTIAYLAAFGSFPTGEARAAISVIMLLKIVFAVLLVLAHQRFLRMKALMFMIILSFVATLLLSFLQSFVPGILVSITDDIGAIIICIIALVMSLIYAIAGLISAIKAVV
jgi:hypothetical protein